MMRRLIKIILLLVLLAAAGAAGVILRNGVPVAAPPGWLTRLVVYLSRNEAKTAPDASFPELRPAHYAQAPDKMFEHAHEVVLGLGWRVISLDRGTHRLHAVVTTPLLHFKDDFHVTIESDRAGSTLTLLSRSRIGRADYGTNLSHILAFKNAFERKFPPRRE